MLGRNKKGFTLIELLVVIAVIGLLASIVLVAVNSVRMKARDVKRKADLKQIRLALEMYYDTNDMYPRAGACAYGDNCYVYSTAGSDWIPALTAGGYMVSVPVDPINNAMYPWDTGNYSYSYGNVSPDGQAFDLTTQLENTSDSDRCELKCYKFLFDNRNWCTACSGSHSNQIYEDSPLTP
jgi:type II secretion system protein G